MTFKTTYKLKDVLNGHANTEFNNNSVIKIENLFDDEFCAQIRKYILDKEEEIIEKYISDKKGLVLFGSHTSAEKVSIENFNFKAISVKNLNDLDVDTVLNETKAKLN